ncbi:MAG: DNA-processing protein DprA, partial [Planctomycetota bacterium]
PLVRGEKVRGELADDDVWVVAEGDAAYPERLREGLGSDAPPLLFMQGEPDILARRTVAVVGSRSPSRAGERAATRFAARMAEAGWTIVSGGARGIDTAGHHGALGNGATAVVPPRGILEFRWRNPARRRADGGEWCKVGQFPPGSGWKTKYALMRNHTIVALSEATLAVEPRDRGGTWRSSRATLGAGKPLLVMNGSGETSKKRGAEALCRSGAQLVSCQAPPGPEELERIVQNTPDSEEPRQQPLFRRDEAN